MAGGTIQNNFKTGYTLQLVWNVNSQDITNNTSNVTCTLQLVSSGSYYINSGMSTSCSITVNGTTYNSSCNVTISGGQTKTLQSVTVNVPHNSDGAKDCGISGSVAMNVTLSGTYVGTVSVGSTATLPTIPRSSQPTLNVSACNYGDTITIYMNRVSTAFTHTVRYAWSNDEGTIATGVTDSCNWTVPNNFMNYVPSSTSSWGRIIVDTYNGGSLIGTKEVRLDTYVSESVVPSFSSITGVELNTSVSSLIGKFVQRLSNIRLTINGATGVYSSTITGYKIDYNGGSYNSNTIDTGVIGWSGSQTVTATITDSRGRQASKTLTLSAIAYNTPSITGFTVSRANSNGTANDMGTYAKIVLTGSVTSLVNSTEKNTLTYTVYAKDRTISTWTTIKAATTISGLSLNTTLTIGTFDATKSYDFRLDVADKFNTTISLVVMATGIVTMSWSKNGVGIGKVWQSGALDVGGDINTSGKVNATGDVTVGGNLYVNGIAATSAQDAANSIVKRDGNSFIWAKIFNCSWNVDTMGAANYFFDSGDGYTRKKSLNDVRNEIFNGSIWTSWGSPNGQGFRTGTINLGKIKIYSATIDVGANGWGTVTFPAGLFTTIPMVTYAKGNPGGDWQNYNAGDSSGLVDVTASQCRITNFQSLKIQATVIAIGE